MTTATGSVTRSLLSLADLAIDGTTYRFMRDGNAGVVGPGRVAWDKNTVSSPFLHGQYLVSARKQEVEAHLGIRVIGTSQSDLNTKMGALLRAFEQFAYRLTIVVNGITWTWDCMPADYAMGDSGDFQPFHFNAKQQEVVFEYERHPVPVAGIY